MPYAAIRLTAGSMASARKNAISTFVSNPMSWSNAQLPSMKHA